MALVAPGPVADAEGKDPFLGWNLTVGYIFFSRIVSSVHSGDRLETGDTSKDVYGDVYGDIQSGIS
jgi:hypothetical protein